VARLLGFRRVPPRPHPSEGVGQHHHQFVDLFIVKIFQVLLYLSHYTIWKWKRE